MILLPSLLLAESHVDIIQKEHARSHYYSFCALGEDDKVAKALFIVHLHLASLSL